MEASEHLEMELIAAFIDGRLSGAERERVVKLLGESEAAFEIYAGALGARADLESDRSVISIARGRDPRPRRWWIAVPLAAAAALVVAVLPTLRGKGESTILAQPTQSILQPLLAQSAVRPLVGNPAPPQTVLAALEPGWEDHAWPVMRGGGAVLIDSTAALRLGVRVTDLRIALGLGDREVSVRIAGEIRELLGSVKVSDASRAEYDGIRTQISAGDSIERIVGAASRAEDALGVFLDSPWFGLGKWFSAGEVAARAHSAGFFKSDETMRFLDSAVQDGRLGPEDVQALRDVAGLARRGVRDDEFETVRQKFAELIRRHGG